MDLWSKVAAQIVTRPPGSVTITKVKSHQSLPETAFALERWKVCGNDFAGKVAKNAVKKYLDEKAPGCREWKANEEETISNAVETTALLHEI